MKLSLLFVVILSASLSVFGQSFKNDAWLEDFAQLKQEMSAHYANLEWSVNERGLNLKQLSADTEAKLREAKNENEAKIALENFLREFGDGHLRIDWATSNTAPTSQTPPSLCARLGYQSRPLRPGVDFTTLKLFQTLNNDDSKYIPAGSGTLTNGKRFGVFRIALFNEGVFPELCEKAVAELKLSADAACDGKCENDIRVKTANYYTAALVAQVERLKKEKIDVLLVDLTGNGGGNDVYQPMARILTNKPLRSPAAGFVRHAHWVKQHTDRLADLEAEGKTASPALQKFYKQAAEAVRQDLA